MKGQIRVVVVGSARAMIKAAFTGLKTAQIWTRERKGV